MKNVVSIIGRAEKVDLIDLGISSVPAKIDTGANSSSIWVSQITNEHDGLYCVFFGPESLHFTGNKIKIDEYSVTRIANSFGQKELRYKIKLRIRVKGRVFRATFTLSNRSLQTYPILLGRRLLRGKFVVDVMAGQPLIKEEKDKKRRLSEDLNKIDIVKEAV